MQHIQNSGILAQTLFIFIMKSQLIMYFFPDLIQ